MLCTPCNSSACTCTVRRVARQHNHVVAGELSRAAASSSMCCGGGGHPGLATQRCACASHSEVSAPLSSRPRALLDRHVREHARTPVLEPHIHVILIGY